MRLTKQKSVHQQNEMGAFRHREVFSVEAGKRLGQGEESPTRGIRRGARWSTRDIKATLAVEVAGIGPWHGRIVVRQFDCSSGGSQRDGFESLLSIDDEAYPAVDIRHPTGWFPRRGLPRAVEGADIAQLDPVADGLNLTAKAVIETVLVLGTGDLVRLRLRTMLDRETRALDGRDPGQPAFCPVSAQTALSARRPDRHQVPPGSVVDMPPWRRWGRAATQDAADAAAGPPIKRVNCKRALALRDAE